MPGRVFQCPDSEVRKHWRHTLMRTSESKGHWQLYDFSAPFEPEVRNRTPGTAVRTSGSGHWQEKTGMWFERRVQSMMALTVLATAAAIGTANAQALDKVSFGTNWVAEAEHGGFYQ